MVDLVVGYTNAAEIASVSGWGAMSVIDLRKQNIMLKNMISSTEMALMAYPAEPNQKGP